MEGVTTAIVAFLFVCIVFPTMVKNKPQYYAAFAAVVLIILLSGLEAVITLGSFHAFATFFIGVLQVAAMLLLLLACGGLTVRQLAGEVSHAFEVMRRGETQKEVIIPIRGQMPTPQRPTVYRDTARAGDEGRVYTVDTPQSDEDSSVPLE